MNDNRPLATTEDVAAYFGVSPRTLDRWAYEGTGPKYSKIGGQRRYQWKDVEGYVVERQPQQVA